jgi:hypothetical protein
VLPAVEIARTAIETFFEEYITGALYKLLPPPQLPRQSIKHKNPSKGRVLMALIKLSFRNQPTV